MKKKRNYKKLTIDDRMIIQAGLANHESLTQIAKSIVEFDSVIGTLTDKKAILTITLVKYNFQFGLLIEKGNSSSVYKTIRNLFDKIGIELAKKIFAICICDNGSEFASFFKLETYNQIQIIKTFYLIQLIQLIE